jgi:hypothetical protein
VSPIPWVTSSTCPGSTTIDYPLPFLASTLHVRNSATGSATLAVGFTPTGIAGSKYAIVPPGGVLERDLRFTSLYLRALTAADVSFTLLVGLTGVASRDVAKFSGSAYFVGVG